MATLMNFDAHVRGIFENEEAKFAAFNKLMVDASVNNYEEGIDAKDANEKIRKIFRQAMKKLRLCYGTVPEAEI